MDALNWINQIHALPKRAISRIGGPTPALGIVDNFFFPPAGKNDLFLRVLAKPCRNLTWACEGAKQLMIDDTR